MTSMQERRKQARTVAVVGTVMTSLYALWAGIQILGLNPLAAVSGRSLRQIYADVAAAGESMMVLPTLGALWAGVALAVAMLVAVFATRTRAVTSIAAGYLILLVLGTPGYFWASFGPGMALADTYLISGGDHSRWGMVLYAVSFASLLGLGVLFALTRTGHHSSRHHPAHA